MSNILKRKAEELEDSDDAEYVLGVRQVLPVARLPDSFDGVPEDGMQYLFTVRRDAQRLPHITRVANPYEFSDVPPPSVVDNTALDSDEGALRNVLLPSEEWRETFLKRFKNFRKNSVQPTIHVHIPNSNAKLMPDKKERDLWWAFLAGRPESEWNPPKKPKQQKPSRWQQRNSKRQGQEETYDDTSLSYDVSEFNSILPEYTPVHPPATPAPTPTVLPVGTPSAAHSHSTTPATSTSTQPLTAQSVSDDRSVGEDTQEAHPDPCLPREPTPSLLQHMDHRYATHLLMYFGYWINHRLEEGSLPFTDITESHARWMFTLLSRVDDWISRDETSQLRTLARGCIGLIAERRKRNASEDETSAVSWLIDDRACWMIITAITGLWGQSDLWMDAESMLSKVERESV